MAGPQPPVSSDATDLAQFGYKQALERRTGRFASFAVAFAFVSIATGIFTTYGSVLNTSGPAGIWTWPIAVVGQRAVAFVLGALAARIPVTGYHLLATRGKHGLSMPDMHSIDAELEAEAATDVAAGDVAKG